MKMTVDIFISPDGKVTADVIDGQGKACISQVLAELEAMLGEATTTKLKPEFQWDTEAIQLLREQGVTA